MPSKALVVEDSEAMQVMLQETLESVGLAADTVQSADEAFSYLQVHPVTLVILDSAAGGGTGLTLLDRLQPVGGEKAGRFSRRQQLEQGPAVIVLRDPAEAEPGGSVSVCAVLVKPFTGLQLREALAAAAPKEPRVQAAASPEDYQPAADPEVELTRRNLSFGESYVFFAENPKPVYEALQVFSSGGYGVMMATVGRAKVARERFGLDKSAQVFTLTGSTGSRWVYPLGTFIASVQQFLTAADHPVVAIDDLDDIIERCGLDRTFRMLHEVLAMRRQYRFTLLVSVDGESLPKKDRDLLTGMMTLYRSSE